MFLKDEPAFSEALKRAARPAISGDERRCVNRWRVSVRANKHPDALSNNH